MTGLGQLIPVAILLIIIGLWAIVDYDKYKPKWNFILHLSGLPIGIGLLVFIIMN
jgi:hypothetical protein